MERDEEGTNSQGQYRFRSIIEQIITVRLQQNCKFRTDNCTELKWITSLQIITQRQFEHQKYQLKQNCEQNNMVKYLQIGNQFYLKIHFCQTDKKPITKIKNSTKSNNPNWISIPYPSAINYQQYLCYEINEKQRGKRIIQDLQMVQVTADNDFDVPEEDCYEVILLPNACQTMPQENSSNQQLIEKTRYLLVKSMDLEDQESIVQYFNPTSVSRFKVQNSSIQLDMKTFHQFCFPKGVELIKIKPESGYQIFNFTLTQQDNTRVYINCLKFKQKLANGIINSLPANCVDRHLHSHQIFYAQQAICIASKYCYTDFFHRLLQQIFRKYQSQCNLIEMRRSKSCTFKSDGHIPVQMHHQILFEEITKDFVNKYELELSQIQKIYNQCEFMKESISLKLTWNHHDIQFPEAYRQCLPSLFSLQAVHCLFKVLTVDNIVNILHSMLLQRNIIFVSDSQIVLGYVIQSLISFLYPLRWEHHILPIISERSIDYLQSPFPLIAGLPTYMATDDLLMSLTQSTVVFLDCNQILKKNLISDYQEINHLRQTVKKLRIYEIYSKDHVSQMLKHQDKFYMFKIIKQEEEKIFHPEHIKNIFFQTILLFLQNYGQYYVREQKMMRSSLQNSPKQSISTKKTMSAQQNKINIFKLKRDYNIHAFINSHPKSLHKFIKKLTECTHFSHFIHRNYQITNNFEKKIIDKAMKDQRMHKSPTKIFKDRFSEQPILSTEVQNLKKKSSLQKSHNSTWSPEVKKSVDSTSYSRNMDKNSLRLQDIQMEKDNAAMENQRQMKKSRGSNICEAISKAFRTASNTSVMIWTQARVARLKKFFVGSEKQKQIAEKNQKEQEKQSQQQKGGQNKQN